MLAKDMLSKTGDELLPQNQKNQNEKTLMVTTSNDNNVYVQHWNINPKKRRGKYHHHILNDIHLKKIFPEKIIIAFRKKKFIGNCIVKTDINEAN